MKKKLLSALLCHALAAVLLCSLPGQAGAASYYVENDLNYVEASMPVGGGIPEDALGTLGQIRRAGVLRVATDAEHPPRTFLDPEKSDDARYAGADLELARYIADRMGVKLKIVQLAPERVLPSLLDGQCDLALSALAFTPARGLAYTMSREYDGMETAPAIGILVRKDSPIRQLSDLAGRIIIAQSSSLAETVAVREAVGYLEFRRAAVAQDVGIAIEEGRADAAFVDVEASMVFFRNNPDSELILLDGIRFTPDKTYLGYRAAAQKGETQLMYFVNGVIEEVQAKGLYEAWLREARERAEELNLAP